MKILTLQTLEDMEACPEQVRLFEKMFGSEVEITPSACVAVASLFDWDWASRNLLSASAWEAYNEVRAPARKEYNEVTEPALKVYEESKASAFANAYNN